MNEYLFRIPKDCPELTYESLTAYLGSRDERAIGATVTVESYREGVIDLLLYGLRIAQIGPNILFFPGPDDPHMATTYWISKIVADNAISGWVGRIRRRKADGPGPYVSRGQAGLLVIGGRDRPVFGRAYPVGDIEEKHRRDAEWQEQMAASREQYAEESRQREALKTYDGPEGSAYAIDANSTGYHWRVIDTTFRDGGAAYDTIGHVLDARDEGNTPPGYLGHLIYGSLEADSNPLSTPYEAFTLNGELIDAYHDLKGALAAVLHESVKVTS